MDEAQYAIPKSIYSCETFDTEEQALEYIENNKINSSIHFSEKLNKYYVSKPNVLTDAITDSIDKTIEFLGLNVELGYEYECGRSWLDCH